MGSRRLFAAFTVAAMLPWSTPAWAQSADQRAAAQVLFDQGKTLVERGSFAEACPKFAEALRLDRGLGTMLWLADCYENVGQTASAWVTFKEAAAAAALNKDPREKVARDRASALEKKLSRLQIIVSPEVSRLGVQVMRDGVAIGVPEHGLAVPVDPGVHAVSATAPGRKPWSTNVSVTPGAQSVAITVPVLEVDASAPQSTPAPSAAAPAGDAPADGDSSRGSTQRTVGLVVGAIGVVGVGVGAFFGLQAKSTYDDSNANGHCLPDNRCDATGKSLREDAESQALIATIAIGAGAAALVTGGVLFFTAPKDRGVALVPSASPQGGGLTLRARF